MANQKRKKNKPQTPMPNKGPKKKNKGGVGGIIKYSQGLFIILGF